MGTWSIVEGDGASITPDGLVTIPSLPSGSKTYKIKYISSDDGCECYHTITQSAPPPVGCTYTVYSDQNGASVSWRNGSTVVQTGTISMGSHSFNSTASGPLSVYLTKPGCTFPDNGEYCYCDDYVTINGNCSGPSPEYCTYTVYSDQNGASVSWSNGDSGTIVRGSHSTTASSGSYTATLYKDGCTFSNNGALCYCDDSVIINGDCSGPSTECAFTVKSNIAGFKATFRDPDGNDHTPYVGTASEVTYTNSNYTSMTVTLSKDGCTFTDNGKTVTCDKSVTINGTCSSPGPGEECTCSKAHFSVTGKTIEAGSNVTIAEYTADCDDGAEVRNEGGDNFLNVSNATFSNGKIKISSVSEVSSNKSGNYAVYIDGTRCDGFTVKQNKPSGGNIDKTITLTIQTTQSKIYMSSIDATISLQPKTPGVGSSVTLGGTGWLNEQNCTDWTNNWSQSIHLSGSYTGSISDYNFQVSFQRRVLKKQKTTTTCDTLSDVTATGTMNGVGTSSTSMSSGGVFSVGLTSESNIGSSISVLLTTR